MNVEVYFNLHAKCWSVRALEGMNRGRVICHAQSVGIEAPRFVVQRKGRERVLREGRKNVHAFVRGALAYAGDSLWRHGESGVETPSEDFAYTLLSGPEVTYNPYKAAHFTLRKSPTTRVMTATRAVLASNRKVYAEGVGTISLAI